MIALGGSADSSDRRNTAYVDRQVAMIVLRSEPRGEAFWALLEIAHSRGLGAGFMVDGALSEDWRVRIAELGELNWLRRYGATVAVDAELVGFMPLSERAKRLVFDIFDSRLFGSNVELRAQDLFLADEPAGEPFLATTTSEMDAAVDLTQDALGECVRVYPGLSGLVLSATGVRFLNEPHASELLSEVAELAEGDQVILLDDALEFQEGEYRAQEKALAAAELVLGALRPELIGDIAWNLTGASPPPSSVVESLVSKAIFALRAVKVAPEWRQHWSRYHALQNACSEVDWLLDVADVALSGSTGPALGPSNSFGTSE